jgi:TRAP-type C4-dicarboxylate transport system permease small subunit
VEKLSVNLLKKVAAIFNSIVNILAVLAGIIMAFIMFAVNLEVVARYLGHPTKWVIDATSFGLLFITFFGAAWLLRREGHVKMEIVVSRLSPRTQTFIDIVTSVLATIACLVITWSSVQITWRSFQTAYHLPTTTEPIAFPILAVIPVGSFFLSIQFIIRIYGYLKRWRASIKDKE